MEELIEEIELNIEKLKLSIQHRKSIDYFRFSNESDHLFVLLKLVMQLEDFEMLLKLILKYKCSRCTPIERMSKVFEKTINVQLNGRIPGLIRKEICDSMVEYMKQLEWNIDSLNGIWKS